MVDPIVELQSGFVRGALERHEDGFDYYAFKGIPYAEPPVDELRFKDPMTKKPWSGVIDCKNYGPACLQHDPFFNARSYDEDCLHLNVFSRSINNENENNPVMFVIHGGIYMNGSSNDFLHGPDHLIRKNVVLVIINYRIGILGFLNLDHEVAPGNQGLKDQLLALQWVQRNIRQFGGDPGNVTILGLSAGACCAHYLTISALSRGLFHRVIFQGATLYTVWGIVKNHKSIVIKLCLLMGKTLSDPVEIFQFLKSLDSKQLLEAQIRLRDSMDFTINTLPWGPGIDDKSATPVLPYDPFTVANQGVHVPCIVGYNAHEAIIQLIGMTREEFFQICNIDFVRILFYNATEVLQRYNLNVAKIRRMYYQNETVSEDNLDKYTNLHTEISFMEGVHRFTRVQVEESSAPTYLYQFSYETPNSIGKSLIKNPPRGCCHFDDLPFLFKMRALEERGLENVKKGTKEYRIMEQMTEMWTNFAKYGKPTVGKSELIPVDWFPVNDGTVFRYLNIDEDMGMQSTINIEQKLLTAKND